LLIRWQCDDETAESAGVSCCPPQWWVYAAGCQKEGLVTHVVIDGMIDYTDMLRSIGGLSFPHRTRSADGAKGGGGPDPRDPKWPKPHEGFYPPFNGGADPEDVIRLRSHDFY